MTKQYLTANYLEKLLKFIIEEHFLLKNESLEEHAEEIDKLFIRTANALWEYNDDDKDKKRGGQIKEEVERVKMAIDLMDRYKLCEQDAYEAVLNFFPIDNSTDPAAIQRLRRTYQRKRTADERNKLFSGDPLFHLQTHIIKEADVEELQKDGSDHFKTVMINDVLQRIEQRLKQ